MGDKLKHTLDIFLSILTAFNIILFVLVNFSFIISPIIVAIVTGNLYWLFALIVTIPYTTFYLFYIK